jgi:predicted enzyme related to lactoylglutathione lyase
MSTTAEQLVTGVDFIGIPTHDLDGAVGFYGAILGLHRSVYMPERNFAEF